MSRSVKIRIQTKHGAMDWLVDNPENVSFALTLEAIHQITQDTSIPAFDYIDEEGDEITVRSDEEFRTMLSSYIANCENEDEPLVISPIGGKPEDRNLHGLKVECNGGENGVEAMEESPSGPGSSSKKQSGDIREILACGNISNEDLESIELLGTGNCGTVYKSIFKPSGTLVAVKVIPLDISLAAQNQIISELEILYKCKSESIIAFHGAFFIESRISICTEYMDGGSLDKYGQIPEPILGLITVSVVRGLQYLWSLKIMHRDVKPSNMLVNTQGQVKLCDFGVSVQLIDSIAKTFIGTNAYMAPERIKGNQYGFNSDVWSLGVSLFEMATAKFPYESAKTAGSKAIDLIKSIVDKDPPRLAKSLHSEAFVHFVTSCMQKIPEKRPAPQALTRHPFVEHYTDEDSSMLVTYVTAKLKTL